MYSFILKVRMKKHRVNISIDRDLHDAASAHAMRAHHTDFSGLVVKLLIADLRAAGLLALDGRFTGPAGVSYPLAADPAPELRVAEDQAGYREALKAKHPSKRPAQRK